MNRRILLSLVLMLCLVLAACSAPEPENTESIEAAVLDNQNGLLTVARSGNGADLYTVSVNDVPITGEDGAELDVDSLTTGQLVRIEYTGPVAESYPAQLMGCRSVQVIGEAEPEDLEAAGVALAELAGQFSDLGDALGGGEEESQDEEEVSEEEPEDETESSVETSEAAAATDNQASPTVQPDADISTPTASQAEPAPSSQPAQEASRTESGGYSFNLPVADPLEKNPDRANYALAEEILAYVKEYATAQGLLWDSSVSRTSFDVPLYVGSSGWETDIQNRIDTYMRDGDMDRIWAEIMDNPNDNGTLIIRIYR